MRHWEPGPPGVFVLAGVEVEVKLEGGSPCLISGLSSLELTLGYRVCLEQHIGDRSWIVIHLGCFWPF